VALVVRPLPFIERMDLALAIADLAVRARVRAWPS
jgi:hypothetical protein